MRRMYETIQISTRSELDEVAVEEICEKLQLSFYSLPIETVAKESIESFFQEFDVDFLKLEAAKVQNQLTNDGDLEPEDQVSYELLETERSFFDQLRHHFVYFFLPIKKDNFLEENEFITLFTGTEELLKIVGNIMREANEAARNRDR
jgi:hypothetical protein